MALSGRGIKASIIRINFVRGMTDAFQSFATTLTPVANTVGG